MRLIQILGTGCPKCRKLYDSDPYWGEHLTTHRWPTTIWLGK